jgi:IS30 family transposase
LDADANRADPAGMLHVDNYLQIRLLHRDGLSIRQIAKRLGHSRDTVKKALVQPASAENQCDFHTAQALGWWNATAKDPYQVGDGR